MFGTIFFGITCLRLVKGSPTTTVLNGLDIVGIYPTTFSFLKFQSQLCLITPIVFFVVIPLMELNLISL